MEMFNTANNIAKIEGENVSAQTEIFQATMEWEFNIVYVTS